MSLLPSDEQSGGGTPAEGEGLEAYVPASKAGKRRASPAPAAEAPVETPSKASEVFGSFGGLRVSLMPGELEGASRPDGRRGLLILALVLVVETLLIGGAYFWVTRSTAARVAERDRLQLRVDQLSRDIATQEKAAEKAAVFFAQVAAVREALDGHLYWSGFFEFLESKTRPTVKYLNFSGDADTRVITLDAVGQTYRDVAEQIVTLRSDPLVEEVRTSSASARVSDTGEVTGVSFSMVIKVKPDVWKKPRRNGTAASTGSSTAAPVVVDDKVSPDATDCGTDESTRAAAATKGSAEQCFDRHLAACTTAAATRSFTDSGATTVYEILGPVAGGCRVRVIFTEFPDPDALGQEMTCVFDPNSTLGANLQAASTSQYNRCSGALVSYLLRPSNP